MLVFLSSAGDALGAKTWIRSVRMNTVPAVHIYNSFDSCAFGTTR